MNQSYDKIMDPQKNIQILLKRIRVLLLFFIIALFLSGLTAFPLQWETDLLNQWFGLGTFLDSLFPNLSYWISHVHQGLNETYKNYPFIAYGTDWLAFAHIAIAIAFIGPLRDPVKNIWVIEFGLIACILIIPAALICGSFRGIPLFWRIIDCSFGIVGFIPLWICRNYIKRIQMQA
jgi:hypothetical protein